MRFCLIDDDPNIVQMLTNIIEDKELGNVVGKAHDGVSAIGVIKSLQPDMVLIDYLMPQCDGSAVVHAVRGMNPQIQFILISQVTDKAMVSQAYQEGIQFFISKPINVIEVETVIRSVQDKINMKRTISTIRGMIDLKSDVRDSDAARLGRIRTIMGQVGVLGEKGSYDIMKICEYALNHQMHLKYLDLNLICGEMEEDTKILKQRIRRAVHRGLVNMANSGIEDYMNEYFMKYSGTLFDFENVRAEMEYIRGKRSESGRVNINKFIEGLFVMSERL